MPLLPRGRVVLAASLPLVLLSTGCAYLSGDQGRGDSGSADCAAFKEWQGHEGKNVEIYASIRDVEGERMQEAWQDFSDCTGITIKYEGSAEFEAQIQVKVDGGNAPDLAFFPQPGLLERFADSGDAKVLPKRVRDRATEGYPKDWLGYATHGGELYGTPLGANVKSTVWYSPKYFKAEGYQVPETWDELMKLTATMAKSEVKPWCAGIESGEATGWPATDWVENVMLRENGPEVYDQWVEHEIPFDDPKVQKTLDRVDGIWREPDYVNAGFGDVKSIVTTSSHDAGLPVAEGKCGMHLMGTFYAANWSEDVEIADDGDVFAFNLPPIDESIGTPVLGGGEFAAAFTDRPEVAAVQEYLATADYADRRAAAGSWFSAHKDLDLDALKNPNDRLAAELLRDPDTVFRWDGADIMPAAVGSGTFWKGMTNWLNGDDTDAVLTYIEKSWPK